MTLSYRVHLSVFPLGSSEPSRVLAAVKAAWLSPAWIASRELRGAWLFEAAMEAPLPPDESESHFAERLSMAIWQKLGRYVRVVVDASAEESDESCHHELERKDYLKLMRTN